MNPWHEKLGCEVNVCQAKQCDQVRMKICALRKNYLWRVNMLKINMEQATGKTRERMKRMLDGLKQS